MRMVDLYVYNDHERIKQSSIADSSHNNDINLTQSCFKFYPGVRFNKNKKILQNG